MSSKLKEILIVSIPPSMCRTSLYIMLLYNILYIIYSRTSLYIMLLKVVEYGNVYSN